MSIEDISLKINDLVIEKTLSLEAIKVVEQIRSEYKLLQETLEKEQTCRKYWEKLADEERNKLFLEERKNANLIEELNKFKDREQDLISRESKLELKDLEIKLTNQSKNETLDLVKCIFRNPVTTRHITKNEHVKTSYKDSYGNVTESSYPVTNTECIIKSID